MFRAPSVLHRLLSSFQKKNKPHIAKTPWKIVMRTTVFINFPCFVLCHIIIQKFISLIIKYINTTLRSMDESCRHVSSRCFHRIVDFIYIFLISLIRIDHQQDFLRFLHQSVEIGCWMCFPKVCILHLAVRLHRDLLSCQRKESRPIDIASRWTCYCVFFVDIFCSYFWSYSIA